MNVDADSARRGTPQTAEPVPVVGRGANGDSKPAESLSDGDCMVVMSFMRDHDCRCTRGTAEHWQHRCPCGVLFWESDFWKRDDDPDEPDELPAMTTVHLPDEDVTP